MGGLERVLQSRRRESNHKRDVIINRLRESLGPEHRNLKKIENMRMSEETGEAVRSLRFGLTVRIELMPGHTGHGLTRGVHPWGVGD